MLWPIHFETAYWGRRIAVPDELFDRAVGVGKSEAVHNAVQHPAASPRTASQGPTPVMTSKAHKPSRCEGLRVSATSCDEGEKWTRSQRIRTAAEVPLKVALLDTPAPPLYQRIAHKALHLHELGLNNTAIARRIGVTHHTVAKAIAWLRRASQPAASRSAR